jgi:hypothetical protein
MYGHDRNAQEKQNEHQHKSVLRTSVATARRRSPKSKRAAAKKAKHPKTTAPAKKAGKRIS